MSEKAPKRTRSSWFAFYADDYLGGTRAMSLSARGAFVDLLVYQFAHDGIPNDDRMICRILGAFPDEWETIREEVFDKFPVSEDGLRRNPRMSKERDEREGIRSKRVEASQKGNQVRWQKAPKCDPKIIPSAIPNAIPNGTVLGIATTTTTTTTESSNEDSVSLAKQGKSLESISARLAIPVANLVEHGATLGMSAAVVRSWADNRVSSNWCNPKGKPLTTITWPADMSSFAAVYSQISAKTNNGKNYQHHNRNDGTANAGRASAFGDLGKRMP